MTQHKIAVYTHMPMTNRDYVGTMGVSMFMIPLLNRCIEDGHEVKYCGKVASTTGKNTFCEVMKLKPYILSLDKRVEVTQDAEVIDECDSLLVYNRPPFVEDEFKEQNDWIRRFVNQKKEVLFWMGDLWEPEESLRKDVILLRPFLSDEYDKNFKAAYEFHYFTHPLHQALEDRERVISYTYIGNQYNRWEELYNYFKDKSGSIIIGGNHLSNSDKWNKSLRLENVLFIREVSHDMALPLLSISKKTPYIIPQQYRDVKMITSRIYESKMLGTEIILDEQQKTWVNLNQLNTLDDAYKKFIDILRK